MQELQRGTVHVDGAMLVELLRRWLLLRQHLHGLVPSVLGGEKGEWQQWRVRQHGERHGSRQ